MAPQDDETHTLLVGGYGSHLSKLSFSPRSRSITRDQVVHTRKGTAPSWLCVSLPKRTDEGESYRVVYAIDETGDMESEHGEVYAFKLQANGNLDDKPMGSVFTGVKSGCHCTLTPNEDALLVAPYSSPAIAVVSLDPATGAFTSSSSGDSSGVEVHAVKSRELGPHASRQDAAHPHQVALCPRGQYVVVPDLGTDDLRVYALVHGATTTTLKPVCEHKLEPSAGPRHVLFGELISEREVALYVLHELGNAVSSHAFVYPAPGSEAAPTIRPLMPESASMLPDRPAAGQSAFEVWHAAELCILSRPTKPTAAATLLASNRAEQHDPHNGTRQGPHDLLAAFTLDGGALGKRDLLDSGGRAPRHLAPSPCGRFLAVSLHDSDEVVVFGVGYDEGGLVLDECARWDAEGQRPAVALWL